MPILIGAAMIAVAILLSTLITAVGTRFVGMESPTEETVWLVDRLTGSVYKCQSPERGKASCEVEIATGSIAAGGKRWRAEAADFAGIVITLGEGGARTPPLPKIHRSGPSNLH